MPHDLDPNPAHADTPAGSFSFGSPASTAAASFTTTGATDGGSFATPKKGFSGFGKSKTGFGGFGSSPAVAAGKGTGGSGFKPSPAGGGFNASGFGSPSTPATGSRFAFNSGAAKRMPPSSADKAPGFRIVDSPTNPPADSGADDAGSSAPVLPSSFAGFGVKSPAKASPAATADFVSVPIVMPEAPARSSALGASPLGSAKGRADRAKLEGLKGALQGPSSPATFGPADPAFLTKAKAAFGGSGESNDPPQGARFGFGTGADAAAGPASRASVAPDGATVAPGSTDGPAPPPTSTSTSSFGSAATRFGGGASFGSGFGGSPGGFAAVTTGLPGSTGASLGSAVQGGGGGATGFSKLASGAGSGATGFSKLASGGGGGGFGFNASSPSAGPVSALAAREAEADSGGGGGDVNNSMDMTSDDED